MALFRPLPGLSVASRLTVPLVQTIHHTLRYAESSSDVDLTLLNVQLANDLPTLPVSWTFTSDPAKSNPRLSTMCACAERFEITYRRMYKFDFVAVWPLGCLWTKLQMTTVAWLDMPISDKRYDMYNSMYKTRIRRVYYCPKLSMKFLIAFIFFLRKQKVRTFLHTMLSALTS